MDQVHGNDLPTFADDRDIVARLEHLLVMKGADKDQSTGVYICPVELAVEGGKLHRPCLLAVSIIFTRKLPEKTLGTHDQLGKKYDKDADR